MLTFTALALTPRPGEPATADEFVAAAVLSPAPQDDPRTPGTSVALAMTAAPERLTRAPAVQAPLALTTTSDADSAAAGTDNATAPTPRGRGGLAGSTSGQPFQPTNGYSGGGTPGHDPTGHSAPTGDLPIPLLVEEALPPGTPGIARTDAMATFGLPFSRGQIHEIAGRPAIDVAGTEVHQARTLLRWPDGSVKWAQLDAQLSLTPDEVHDGLTVVAGDGRSDGPDIARPFLAGKALILDTGPLQAVVLTKAFNVLAYVRVDGETVVRPNLGLGLYGTALDGGLLRPGVGTLVTVEENGPARAVVRADGPLIGVDGQTVIDFTCRITARAGARDLEVTVTLRNASAQRPWHAQLQSVEVLVRADPGGYPVARAPLPGGGVHSQNIAAVQKLRAYQATSSAPVNGFDSSNWEPHIPRVNGSLTQYVDEGYQLTVGQQVLFGLGDQDDWPDRGWVDLTGPRSGVTVAMKHMAFQWPAALEVGGDGLVVAGLFTPHAPQPYTFVFQQHESRTAVFSFHAGTEPAPEQVSHRADFPVVGRAADYLHYDRTGVLPYRLLTPEQHAEAYSLMGITHNIQANHPEFHPTRYLYKATTGPSNNSPLIETQLVGEWLRLGFGGSFLQATDLALWKSEWQVARSDDFVQANVPDVLNDELPHTKGNQSDDEHRWRDGMVLAYLLTGDERIHEALLDEVEVLQEVDLWPHERSMYQTLRAMGAVLAFTQDAALRATLKERLQYVTSPLINVDVATSGFGWEDTPGNGLRRYYVFSGDLNSEKPPGEHFQARGFMSGTLGPAGYHEAAQALMDLEPNLPIALNARKRAADLAWWTRHELYPWHPDPAQRKLVYSYAVSLQQVVTWDSFQFHPILLGMAEAFELTGDVGYLDHAVAQVQAHAAVDTGPFSTNLHLLDTRLECQHFFALYREWKLGL